MEFSSTSKIIYMIKNKLLAVTLIVASAGFLFSSSAAFAAAGFTVQRSDEAQVKIGMGNEEVQKLLGRPSRNVKYANEPGQSWTYGVNGVDNGVDDTSTVFDVNFDAQGKVLGTSERIERIHTKTLTAE